MTPIEVLLSLELLDAHIARRLRVSRMTVSRWRTKRCTPEPRYQTIALAYLNEIKKKIDDTIQQAAFKSAA